MGQDVVSLCVLVQRSVTPKFAPALAEAITAPAKVLKLARDAVTSISSGRHSMSPSFSTTVLVTGWARGQGVLKGFPGPLDFVFTASTNHAGLL
jgi:hypothetical protein